MKNTHKILFFFTLLIITTSCGSKKKEEVQQVSMRGEVFGTYYNISYFAPGGENYQEELEQFFNDFNNSLSYYVPNSVISRVNRNETDTLDAYFLEVLKQSMEVYENTDGAFDPTVSPLVNAWGFGFENRQEMTQEKIDSLLSFTGLNKVRIKDNILIREIAGIQFDFNAIAKGYASDLAGKLLEEKGIENYLVELGGDLIAKGEKPDGSGWRIGLERPAQDKNDVQHWEYLVELTGQGLATSGSYRRYYEEDGERFSHTIDPETGRPVTHNLLSVSVFAPTCLEADAYATAFMVMGREKAKEFLSANNQLQAFFIYSDQEGDYQYELYGDVNIIHRDDLSKEQ